MKCTLIYKFSQRNTSIRKQFLLDVLTNVKQLGIPAYLLIMSCADLRLEEVPYIINKLNNQGISGKELKNISYRKLCNL